MQAYKPRTIAFKEVVMVNDWKVKVYTLSRTDKFDHPAFYHNAIDQLPQWLEMKNKFNDSNNKIAFLILHAGTEGIFSLINWWVGSNMLNTHIFLSEYEALNQFKKISGSGLAPCIWELEIIHFESTSWTKNVLQKAPHLDFDSYLKETINVRF